LPAARNLRTRAAEAARWRAYYDARRRQALEHPTDPLPPFGIAALWLEAGEPKRALSTLDALLSTSPNHARSHALRGDAARALGDLDTSLAAWSRALELNPDLHTARLNRAILQTARKQYPQAKADLTLLVQLPESRTEPLFQAHNLLAQVRKALGE
jgi:tetratricopeptide (TPR) repeat protein